jgi:hypothetical protein
VGRSYAMLPIAETRLRLSRLLAPGCLREAEPFSGEGGEGGVSGSISLCARRSRLLGVLPVCPSFSRRLRTSSEAFSSLRRKTLSVPRMDCGSVSAGSSPKSRTRSAALRSSCSRSAFSS